jgi:hydrogenase-4 component B
VRLFLAAVAILCAGGLSALFVSRFPRLASYFGSGSALLGCVLGLVAAIRALAGNSESLRLSWDVPYGSFYVGLDKLSAFFLIPLFALSAVGAIYGSEYLLSFRARRSLGPPWFFYNWLIGGMAVVVVAKNGVLFLVAWEAMSLASFFLVTFENEREDVRDAGWTYLVATHLGNAFLLALFLLLGNGADSLDFDQSHHPANSGALFLLALVGFGTKAGFMPLHVWLPEAHPAAPSHVSALMSGVMIKTGIYGLVRTITLLGDPAPWWGWTLVAIGITSGILGVLFALAQHDLKRLLAYHSVENIGIIALGLGVGLLGLSYRSPALAALGFAGGLLHVVNHAVFKGLLFLGAGAVVHATGTREIDRLGGLLKKMPLTGLTFLIGAAAITGLPPLNGFVSEFLIFLGAYKGVASQDVGLIVPTASIILGLALIGGLAAACFTKAFGVVFLGEPRTGDTASAHEPGPAMRIPMILLAAGCFGIGILSPWMLGSMGGVIEFVAGPSAGNQLIGVSRTLNSFVLCGAVLLVLITLLAALRKVLLAGRPVGGAPTWDCGYARPMATMQYTASSFAQPLTDLFGQLLRTSRHASLPLGLFPSKASLATETPDVCREELFQPLFLSVDWALSKLRRFQTGHVHLYVLYIALTLVVLLAWKIA